MNTTVVSTPVVTRKRSNNASVIAISTSTGVATLILVVGIFFFFLRRRKLMKSWLKYNSAEDEIDTLESFRFGLGDIKHATQGFSESNKLGQGGFGAVYKGVLPDGQEIAVKRLLRSTLRGEGDGQSKNEILILAKLQHRNLVRLLGYCIHKGELLLVYELVQNRSLDKFLFDPLQRHPMVWETRYRIISGICRGLLYLHEESRLRIIHRDLKAANVLLDIEFNPKIADFGMARMFSIHQTQAEASKIVGTFGYMPPEYVFQGQVSMKLDVYSFGVLLLEIVTGQRISKFLDAVDNPEDLLSFAWKCWRDGTAWNIVDPTISTRIESESNDLFNRSSRTEILRCIHIGLLCVQDNPADRPAMSSIALMLQSTSLSLPVPRQPALFVENTLTPSNVTSAKCSLNFVSVTELHPR